jgi:hypothetical protein
VKCRGIYPGVDAVFYGNQRQLEYDFMVAPGADPKQISLGLTGATPSLDSEGNVLLRLADGDLALKKPIVYAAGVFAIRILPHAGDRHRVLNLTRNYREFQSDRGTVAQLTPERYQKIMRTIYLFSVFAACLAVVPRGCSADTIISTFLADQMYDYPIGTT